MIFFISLYLDWQVSKINKLIAAKKKQIVKLQEYEQSAVYDIITGHSNHSKVKKDSKIDWVREIPASWDVLFLSQVACEQCVKNTGMVESNLLSLSYGRIVEKDINATDGLLPLNFEGYQIVYPGNIVLRLTDLQNDHRSLRTGLVSDKGIITSAYTTLKAKNNILPAFLRLQLHAADLCKVFYGMGGGVRQSISYEDIRRMKVFVPPLEEQEKIITIIEGRGNKITLCIEAIKDEIKRFEELKTRLISDVVTGQIDVRNIEVPDFETVEEADEDVIEEKVESSEVADE